MRSLLLAVGFLTVLPMRVRDATMREVGHAGMWFPIVGFFMGLTVGAIHLVFLQFFTPLLAATLTVVLWIALTGGLHLDGLADCCDGLFVSALPERRLEIMRDPRVGSFSVIGLVLMIALKIIAINSIITSQTSAPIFGIFNTYFPIGVFVLAMTISRWVILLVALQPQARANGMGAEFARGITRRTIIIAAIVPILFVVACFISWQMIIPIVAAHAIAFIAIRIARVRLGGVTGDVMGLTVEVSEVIILLTFATR